MKEAADCDVLDRDVTQWRKKREGEITEMKRNKKSVMMKGLKKSENKSAI